MTKNVRGSTVLLVILTEGYFKSSNCLKELGTASAHALRSLCLPSGGPSDHHSHPGS